MVTSIFFIGVYNVHPLKGRAWGNLMNFSHSNNLTRFDFDMLPRDIITFIFYGNLFSKWLDHVVKSLQWH